MARPTKYNKEVHPIVSGWLARHGYIDTEIAEAMGITQQTLNNWKKKHKEFFESLKENKQYVDSQVEDKLLKRAMGYNYNEVHIKKYSIISNGSSIPAIEEKTITKEVVPDVTAQIFWLKNRQPKMWRDKHVLEHEIDEETKENLEELRNIAQEHVKKYQARQNNN